MRRAGLSLPPKVTNSVDITKIIDDDSKLDQDTLAKIEVIKIDIVKAKAIHDDANKEKKQLERALKRVQARITISSGMAKKYQEHIDRCKLMSHIRRTMVAGIKYLIPEEYMRSGLFFYTTHSDLSHVRITVESKEVAKEGQLAHLCTYVVKYVSAELTTSTRLLESVMLSTLDMSYHQLPSVGQIYKGHITDDEYASMHISHNNTFTGVVRIPMYWASIGRP